MILDNFAVTDKVAIVTGAGQGIGRSIAIGLAEAGADVVVAARTSSDLDEVVARIEKTGRRAVAVRTDVMETDQLEHLVAETLRIFGRVDILINNAGGTAPRPAMMTSERFFHSAVHFNAIAPFLLTQFAAQAMVDTAGGGSVVNISSRAADMVLTSFVAYGVGKAALTHMTKNLAAELAPLVRVNAIGTGAIDTRALATVMADEQMRSDFLDRTPMARAGEPEDIACAALYLASPASSWVTGTILNVDGGSSVPAVQIPAPPRTTTREVTMPTTPTTPTGSGQPDGGASVPLRERQRNALRSDIQQAALRMFAAQGFDNVTTEAIAEEVGISPSTFFRHVPSKEHLLLGATQRGRAQIVANFHGRPLDEDIADSLAAAILTRTAQFMNDGETIELWRRAMASAPIELRRASLLNREDCDELIGAVALRLDDSATPADMRAGVLVRAAVAAVEYAYEWWLTYDQTESLHTLTERALEQVTRGSQDQARRTPR